MAEHLSPFALDEAAAGEPSPDDAEHLAACAACRASLDELNASRAQLLASPESQRRWSALAAGVPQRKPGGLLRAALFAAPLAASVLLFAAWPRQQTGPDRLKGAAVLEVLSSSGTPVREARVGERVSLSVGGAGHRFAAVLAVTDDGKVSRLWPPQGTTSSPVPEGAAVRLDPEFVVTPGSMSLYAFFSDAPQSIDTLARALEGEVASTLARGRSALETSAPANAAAASGHARLEVRR